MDRKTTRRCTPSLQRLDRRDVPSGQIAPLPAPTSALVARGPVGGPTTPQQPGGQVGIIAILIGL